MSDPVHIGSRSASALKISLHSSEARKTIERYKFVRSMSKEAFEIMCNAAIYSEISLEAFVDRAMRNKQ